MVLPMARAQVVPNTTHPPRPNRKMTPHPLVTLAQTDMPFFRCMGWPLLSQLESAMDRSFG